MSAELSVPAVTVEQMREVDRLMIDEYGIGLLQMMENAGRNLARLAANLADEGPGLLAAPLGLHLRHAHAVRHHSLLSGAALYRPWGARATTYMSIRNCLRSVPLMLTGNTCGRRRTLALGRGLRLSRVNGDGGDCIGQDGRSR